VRALALALIVLSTAAFAHEGHLSSLAWAACSPSSLGDACSFDAGGALARGSCRSMSGALICVRNRPLERRGPESPVAVVGLWLAAGVVSVVIVRRRQGSRRASVSPKSQANTEAP
jgi:hypothetical protein